MAEYFSPGVYVEEFDSGTQSLSGVSTSTAGFIGLAQRGPIEGSPVLIKSLANFRRTFGSYLSATTFGSYRFLAYAVEQFFLNGGSTCYVMRVAPSDAVAASNSNSSALSVIAKNPGGWGNDVRVLITPASKAKTQILEVIASGTYRVKSNAGFVAGDTVTFVAGGKTQVLKVISAKDNTIVLSGELEGDPVDAGLLPAKVLSTSEFNIQVSYGDDSETFEKCSLNVEAANYVEKVTGTSNLVSIAVGTIADATGTAFEAVTNAEELATDLTFFLQGGSDGTIEALGQDDFIGKDLGPGNRGGINAFIENDEVSIMAIPGVTEPAVLFALIAHCESRGDRFAILDIPREKTKVADVLAYRNYFDTSYAAMYNPWVQVSDPLEKRNVYIPPSGTVAGIYARVDDARGVQKAPANETLRGVTGLDVQYSVTEQDLLNPQGVNLIRSFTGQGIRVWGARTCSSNQLWKYVNVRRLFIFIETAILRGTNWVVFEPNDDPLWARVRRTVDTFLTRVWRDGALAGASASEAFYVNIGRDTMTQDDIDNGRLICVIGIAPVKPAEFVVFRITQKTSE